MPGNESTIRVLVAGNSRIYTHLLSEALTRDSIMEVIPFEGETSSLATAVARFDIDVLILSANFDDEPLRGVELLSEIRLAHARVRGVVMPESSKPEVVLQAFRAGARGVFGRNEPLELLCKCVRCVHEGQIWASSRDLTIALDALANSPSVRAINANGMNLLSERELQVVQCLAEGLTNREIAERLQLSQHTIKNYFFRIFDKLGVSSRVELLFMTMSQGGGEKTEPGSGVNGNKRARAYSESDLLIKSAEAGLPAAQLALAQTYLARQNDPQNLVEAYKWYLIATESAMQARGLVTRTLTHEQIEEAKQKAGAWFASRKQKSPSAARPEPSRNHADGEARHMAV